MFVNHFHNKYGYTHSMKMITLGIIILVAVIIVVYSKASVLPVLNYKWDKIDNTQSSGILKNEGMKRVSSITLTISVSRDLKGPSITDGACVGQPSGFSLLPGESMLVTFSCGEVSRSQIPHCVLPSGEVRVFSASR